MRSKSFDDCYICLSGPTRLWSAMFGSAVFINVYRIAKTTDRKAKHPNSFSRLDRISWTLVDYILAVLVALTEV
ncbi:hypothetical protein P691DRAFT_803004 [Macrolepiota fuliginosa MF-IS2]|uniref:Uncharacterized protein n=1 Tax=Macrolepiota fuliginosa MF-IS2 TaxID=1400762 RepID=A0A9P5XCL7_9AGAR|nr:hypothetical protein P691DRAFT_803004 [Macrolepiota fuliginosa MF-IS2]